MNDNQLTTSLWFHNLRNDIIAAFEAIELEYSKERNIVASTFERKLWDRPGGGGGEISIMRGNVFEKVGVNISTVHGVLSPELSQHIPGALEAPQFFATGISIVAHMCSPLVPAVHFNTRYLETSKTWFGGGSDLTPMYPDESETAKFHDALKTACDLHDSTYYPRFKKECDQYFYLKHRQEARGVGGIFYDYLNSGDFNNDFAFTVDVGKAFLTIYPEIVRHKMWLPWTKEQRDYQLIRRGRYVEFNLLYDRGTKFGLMTDGNIEAILMSMPPEVRWP
ncbi:oxygen-dependent coproporphyrinogen oxidase [Candidatus Trichorickettsia mobilis]|nr:oxygen-dependent coproporphyrinogen oxidase [Candidatus Trichorickettsia mobilis]